MGRKFPCPLWTHMAHLARIEESGDSMAHAVIKRGTRRCNIGSTRKICYRSTIKGLRCIPCTAARISRHIGIFLRHFPRFLLFFPTSSFSPPTYPCSYRPTARGFCAKERALNTLTRCLMYVLYICMYPSRKCLARTFLRFIFTCGHLKVECGRNLPHSERNALRYRYRAPKIRSDVCRKEKITHL